MARPQTSAPAPLSALGAFKSARIGAFLWRLQPLWLAWVLVWALPPSRDYARQAIWGSGLGDYQELHLSRVWDKLVFSSRALSEPKENPLPAASSHPRDLDLALWKLVFDGAWNFGYPTPRKLEQLATRFPDQGVVLALPVQRRLGLNFWGDDYPNGQQTTLPNRNLEARQLLVGARRGQKLEPQNAFWHMAQARAHWGMGDKAATLSALERAARCPFYDDKTLELARRLLRAHERYGAPTLEQKIAIANRISAPSTARLFMATSKWSDYALKMRAPDPARSVRWSAALAGIGDLMQRAPNGRANVDLGRHLQVWAWRVASKKRPKVDDYAEVFALYAIRKGYPAIARTARAQNKYAMAVGAQTSPSDLTGGRDFTLGLGQGLWQIGSRAQWIEGANAAALIALCAGIYFALWWLAANLFLWRARGVPSSRRARAIPAIVVGAFCVALALATTVVSLRFAPSGIGPSPLVNAILISMLLPGFFGAPFMLALWCALGTLRRHRAAFGLPRRVDVEMMLSPLQRAFLNRFVFVAFVCCLVTALVGLVLWLLASGQGWGNVDILALLPPDRRGRTGSLIWDMSGAPAPLIYGVFTLVLCLPIWFWKWRWASAGAQRPVTQSGLRWWKESLGGLIVFLSWLFLALGLALWPLRAGAEAELDNVLRVGEIARLPVGN